jgi:hypothetical protein
MLKWLFLLGMVLAAIYGCSNDDPVVIPAGQSLADPTGGHGPGGAKAHGEATHNPTNVTVDRGKRLAHPKVPAPPKAAPSAPLSGE